MKGRSLPGARGPRGCCKAELWIPHRVGKLIGAARRGGRCALVNRSGNCLGLHAGAAKIAHADEFPLATETQNKIAPCCRGR